MVATRTGKTTASKTPPDAPAQPPARAGAGTRVRPVPAVSRAIAILRLLGDAEHAMGVKAIADALGLVPSTALHILRVLVSEDLVKIEPATKRYALGGGMISLARSVLRDGGFAQIVQPALDRLATTRGVTAMGVEVSARQSVVVLALSCSVQPFRLHTDVGSEFSTLVSATGRLIAAHSGESWVQLHEKFLTIAWDRAPAFDAWKKEVEHARARGWAVDRDNFMTGITVVAVPLFARSGRLSHTLVAVGLSHQLNAAATAELAATMREEAQAVAQRLADRG